MVFLSFDHFRPLWNLHPAPFQPASAMMGLHSNRNLLPARAMIEFPRCFRTLFIAAAAVEISSCTSLEVAAPPVGQLTLPKTANREKLAEGRQILADSCVKCHFAPRIAHHSKQDWEDDILPTMSLKAKLTDEQAALLRSYVMTAHEALAAHPPG
jgi:mono/diheme cytochrome c family protein